LEIEGVTSCDCEARTPRLGTRAGRILYVIIMCVCVCVCVGLDMQGHVFVLLLPMLHVLTDVS